jgi:hypothetical protein
MKTPLKEHFFDYRGLGTCAAASIEYYLASEHPAQFFEMVEALTSKQKKYTKTVDLDNFNSYNYSNMLVSMIPELPKTHQLDEFKTKYTLKNENNADAEITPDKNAYFLAEITAENRTEDTRSVTDIIMQSAIMNLGSGGTYESISDTRRPSIYTSDSGGLFFDECNYVLKMLAQNSLNLFVYKNANMQNIYTKEDMKNSILDALNRNGSVVAGYYYEAGEHVYDGHEITIIGYTKNMNGDGFFIIQDSDDFEPQKPVLMQENKLLEELNHAFI